MENYKNDYGYVYEYGYNIGLFSGLVQLKSKRQISIKDEKINRIKKWLARNDQNVSALIISFCRKHSITDQVMIERVRRNICRIFFFAFFAGQQMVQNYVKSIGMRPEVIYLQINTSDPLNRGLNQKKSHEVITQEVAEAFKYDMKPSEIDSYQQKGNFLKADSIILLKARRRYFLLVTDNSLYLHHLVDVEEPYQLLQKLLQIRGELGAKTKFRHMSIEMPNIEDIQLDEILIKYAGMIRDKSLLKIVQASSYAYSFLQFISKRDVPVKEFYVSIMAQVDYDYSLINFSLPQSHWQQTEKGDLLYKCFETYRKDIQWSDLDYMEIPKDVKRLLRNNILHNTAINKDELSEFMEHVEGNYMISDYIEGFQGTADKNDAGLTFRDTHAEEVKKGLNNPEQKILFLTGNPGIGKTTAISDELKKHEKFFFLYTSCRRAVNDDILDKFSKENRLFSDDLVVLNTTYTDEEKINGQTVHVVNVVINDWDRLPKNGKITYLKKFRDRDFEAGSTPFYNAGDNEFRELYQARPGVLQRLSEGICEQINNPRINKVIGTFSIQALKRTRRKSNTMEHIYRMFPFVKKRAETDISINLDAFDQFVERYPVCWIMIDEITGTDEGAYLYQLLKKFLFKDIYQELDSQRRAKWNVKLIIADASITNETIIQQSLESRESFDYPKVYITQGEQDIKSLESKEISISVCNGTSLKGWFVNANSYPASKLKLSYHIGVQGIRLDKEQTKKSSNKRIENEKRIEDKHDAIILEKIFTHISGAQQEQIIVYVQNIHRIEKLKQMFIERYIQENGKEPQEYEQYMTITSQLTPKERLTALKVTDQVQCVFMTSSASRGISFPNATKILAVLQTFRLERELVEQVQVYYRMRGHKEWDHGKEKMIEFFVVDSYVYDLKTEQGQKDRTLIHLLSFLTLVRACLVSRMFGESKIGRNSFSLVPLGGKGITPIQNSIIQDVAEIIRLSKKELARKGRFDLLRELTEELERVFGTIQVQTNDEIYRTGYEPDNIFQRFVDCAKYNLANLLDFQPFHSYFFVNGMIIFRIQKEFSQRASFSVSDRQSNLELKQKIKQVKNTDLSDDLKKKLNRIYDLLDYEQRQQGKLANVFREELFGQQRYVAFPILAFTMVEQLTKKKTPQNLEENYLDVLRGLVQSFTDVSSVTPITSDYQKIPFITFQSDALEQMFTNRFQRNQLFASTETNMINLLLLAEI
ncbi:helicase-related protein [Thermoflavimicrobium daqui]|uniref:Uncharacterized protein n=1 Tax=Thermoflavimicrobium daqui TaxID=2137476 RepID=A0A364K7X2_9BACL|nr:helicase-related protein [Thermoflavimicrobium daqui]RAL26387.1 hypothetical protein DL897_05190 [Thermoflavimicrobium daqui]